MLRRAGDGDLGTFFAYSDLPDLKAAGITIINSFSGYQEGWYINVHAEKGNPALKVFYELRGFTRLRKRPSTSELIDWIAVLKASGVQSLKLEENLPFLGALLKKEQDLIAVAESFGKGRRTRA